VDELTWDQVTSWRLRRGSLNRRSASSKIPDVIEKTCGLHAQIMSTVPLALGARVSGLKRSHLDEALAVSRTLVKTWGMRGTLHVFTAEDLPLYCAAQRTRDQYMNPSFLRFFDLEMADVEAILDAVPQVLGAEPMTREELADGILRITKRPKLEERLLSGWGEGLKPAAFRGLLCFGPQSGRTVTFVRPEAWLGSFPNYDTDDALQEVFGRFLAAYGPATREEIARWWGVRPAEAGRVLKLMPERLAEVMVGGKKRWILSRDLRSLTTVRPVEGVRLLPSFDQLLVMSAPHKEAIVDEEFARRIYRPRIAVWSLPALLVDGRVDGGWTLARKKTSVLTVKPFKKLRKATVAQLEDEVERVGKLLDAVELRIEVP
jgi:hypothetical protein